jgi:uncharacterized protein DUF6893
MRRVLPVLLALLVPLGILVATQLQDIRRYLRIRAM